MKADDYRQLGVARKMLATDWRLWAAIPAAVTAIEFLVPIDRGADEGVGIVKRPTFPRGVCRKCGCSMYDPCPQGCGWTDRTERLCTACDEPPMSQAMTRSPHANRRKRRNPRRQRRR